MTTVRFERTPLSRLRIVDRVEPKPERSALDRSAMLPCSTVQLDGLYWGGECSHSRINVRLMLANSQ